MNGLEVFVGKSDSDRVLLWLKDVLNQEGKLIQDGLDDERYLFRTADIEIVFGREHLFEDDMGIEFSRYGIVIMLIPLRIAGETYEKLILYLALNFAERIYLELSAETMVVCELQSKVAEFLRPEQSFSHDDDLLTE